MCQWGSHLFNSSGKWLISALLCEFIGKKWGVLANSGFGKKPFRQNSSRFVRLQRHKLPSHAFEPGRRDVVLNRIWRAARDPGRWSLNGAHGFGEVLQLRLEARKGAGPHCGRGHRGVKSRSRKPKRKQITQPTITTNSNRKQPQTTNRAAMTTGSNNKH